MMIPNSGVRFTFAAWAEYFIDVALLATLGRFVMRLSTFVEADVPRRDYSESLIRIITERTSPRTSLHSPCTNPQCTGLRDFAQSRTLWIYVGGHSGRKAEDNKSSGL